MRVGNKAITANHDRLPKEGRKDDERERKSDGEIRARQGKEGGKAGRQGGIELSRTDRAIFEKWTTERESDFTYWVNSKCRKRSCRSRNRPRDNRPLSLSLSFTAACTHALCTCSPERKLQLTGELNLWHHGFSLQWTSARRPSDANEVYSVKPRDNEGMIEGRTFQHQSESLLPAKKRQEWSIRPAH